MKLSFAQNFEDVLLWRVLGHIDNGVYIDVGAGHSSIGSVTKLFYDAGWNGINIEPFLDGYANLFESRPRDINIQKCATDIAGKSIDLIDAKSKGLPKSQIKNKNKVLESDSCVDGLTVDGDTLNNIWDDSNLSEVHFLKIKVDGMEAEVLRGIDLSANRPWVILIQDVGPNLSKINHGSWEKQVADANYELVYFDGLTRFYLAIEKLDLKSKFCNSPNILDDDLIVEMLNIARCAYPLLLEENEALKKGLADNRVDQTNLELDVKDLATKNSQLQQSIHELHDAHQQLAAITSSTIWKVTYPIRYMSMFFRRLRLLIKNAVNYFKAYGFRKTLSKSLAIVAGSNVIEPQDERSHLTLKERKIYEALRQGQD